MTHTHTHTENISQAAHRLSHITYTPVSPGLPNPSLPLQHHNLPSNIYRKPLWPLQLRQLMNQKRSWLPDVPAY